MYIPSKNFDTPQDQELFCPLTGESYVYMECDSLSAIDEKYHNGALELLPQRFFQQAMIMRNADGNISVSVRRNPRE
jgi:hypothetical protein